MNATWTLLKCAGKILQAQEIPIKGSRKQSRRKLTKKNRSKIRKQNNGKKMPGVF
jgi:hypothetical protein